MLFTVFYSLNEDMKLNRDYKCIDDIMMLPKCAQIENCIFLRVFCYVL